MKETAKKLEEKARILKKAITYLQKGDFPSLLHYFQTGYSNVTGHFPSQLLDTDKQVYEAFAILLDKKLAPVQMTIDRQVVKETGTLQVGYEGMVIGVIDPFKKEIILYQDQLDMEAKEKEIATYDVNKNAQQESLVEITRYLEKHAKKQNEFSMKMHERQQEIPKEIETLEAKKANATDELARIKEILERVSAMQNSFAPFDFSVRYVQQREGK